MILIESLGYQYPESDDHTFDGNWLKVKIEVISKRGSFQSVDPCLLTWELK